MDKIAKKLKFMWKTYEFSHAKDNILIYTTQPIHYYDDWEEEGGILVVKYRPDVIGEQHKYLVLHQISVWNDGRIYPNNISGNDKIPEIVED